MKITVLTSTQPRHISLVERLTAIADEVFVVHECKTLFPGQGKGVFPQSPTMERYFERVNAAERERFGGPRFLPANVRQMAMQREDLNLITPEALGPALNSDVFVTFGTSFIRGPLIDMLIAKRAINIHMGTSPYYRGMSCNFWALYDRRPDYVGATVHLLSKGLDSGAILFHAFPASRPSDAFRLGMQAVATAHEAVAERIRTGNLFVDPPVAQDRSHELRYARGSDFTDDVVADYLSRVPEPTEIAAILQRRDLARFARPYVASIAG